MTQSLTYVEIDVPHCANTYGIPPCTASLTASPPTGTIKCFNTRKTCQDIANYVDDDPLTLRFAKPVSYLPVDIFAIPSISDVQITSAVVSLGKDLGQRASVSVIFEDHPDDDTLPGLDPYLSERLYDPFSQGTFWGKFRARNPFIVGAKMRVIFGKVGDALENMETRHFIIDSYEGPSARGKFTIRASDVLKLGDEDKAVAPLPSNGFISAGINSAVTSMTLLPSGVGSQYPASGHINIGGSEIVSFTRSGDVFTITRAQLNTSASAHSAGDRAQLILRYVSQDPADIVYSLCTTYIPGFDASWIDLPTWQDETSTYNGNTYTATICEPTPVKTLLEELILQGAMALWWDDVDEQLRLQVLHAISTTADEYSSENIRRGSMLVTEQLGMRLSQVFIYFGQFNPLQPLTNTNNFISSTLVEDTEAEDNWGQPAIQTILSRWIPAAGRTVADRLGAIILGRFKTPPRKVQFELARYAQTDPVLAGGYHFLNDFVQDETGAASFIPIQVTELKPSGDAYTLSAEEMLFDVPPADLTNRSVIFTANSFNLNLRTEHDSIYPAPTGAETVTFTISSAVFIGSVSTSLPCIDVGTWPSGTTISIILAAGSRIEGHGGAGGVSFAGAGAGTANGSPGGTALYTRKAITLFNSGLIGGGGGGGGGLFSNVNGIGGSGGAGYNPGNGGAGAIASGNSGSVDSGGAAVTVGGSHGGAGGGIGLPGGTGSAGVPPPGGAAGAAVDGHSFVTYSISGDIRGGQIN